MRADELGDFLRAARSRLSPADVGLSGGGRRRTPGLRREEVAHLASVSVDWYTRLEQGRARRPGTDILDAVATALQLTDAEREHLFILGQGDRPRGAEPLPASDVAGSIRTLLDEMPYTPAYLTDVRFTILAHNAAFTALFGADVSVGDNIARLTFLDPATRVSQLDWEELARETVGHLRANAARHPGDALLRALVDELCSASEDFARRWADHTVEQRSHGHKRIAHSSGAVVAVNYDLFGLLDGSERMLMTMTPVDPHAASTLRELVDSLR